MQLEFYISSSLSVPACLAARLKYFLRRCFMCDATAHGLGYLYPCYFCHARPINAYAPDAADMMDFMHR